MRFSLATMLLIMAYAALACVALTQPTYYWTSILWNTSLAILAMAAVGAVATQGRDRAWWMGFAACGWTHYLFSLGPWLEGRFNSYIFSRSVLDFVCVLLEHEQVAEVYRYSQFTNTQPPLHFFLDTSPPVQTYIYFMISGFALFSVASGVAGGWLANYLFNNMREVKQAD